MCRVAQIKQLLNEKLKDPITCFCAHNNKDIIKIGEQSAYESVTEFIDRTPSHTKGSGKRTLSFSDFSKHCIHHVDLDVEETEIVNVHVDDYILKDGCVEVDIAGRLRESLDYDQDTCRHESCSGRCFENTCPIWDRLGEEV